MIPSALGELTELTYLFLGENYLEGQIPESFGRLRKLRQLNLSRNQVRRRSEKGRSEATISKQLPKWTTNSTSYVVSQLVGGIPFSFSQLMCLEEVRCGGRARRGDERAAARSEARSGGGVVIYGTG
jgi:hypothetical protein